MSAVFSSSGCAARYMALPTTVSFLRASCSCAASIGWAARATDAAAKSRRRGDFGVPLKGEETGKLFPVSARARDVVDALLRAAREAGVEVRTGVRVRVIQ